MILDKLEQQLEQKKTQHLYRSRKVLASAQSVEPVIDGRKVLSFCSNDYLGLAGHADVVRRFQQAADQYGVGSGAAHLVSGHGIEHHRLEEELADFMGTERALLFSTGYMANIGVVSALCDRHTEIHEDRLNHASLLDAALLSRAKRSRYQHRDMAQLAEHLKASSKEKKLLLSDGVFSMDGDLAPLPEMVRLAQQFDTALMIDDAHGIGVLGEKGQGVREYFRQPVEAIPVLVGTLGKAFGTAGAFVAGSEALIETLIQQARSYIYTTAMPAAVAAATRESLALIKKESWRREKLASLIQQFRTGASELGLELMESITPIQPVLVGNSAEAMAMSEKLLEKNILVSAIRPPTVPDGTARLRFTFSASHSEAQVQTLLDALEAIQKA